MLNGFNNKSKPTRLTFSIIFRTVLIFSCLCLYATKSLAQENKASHVLEAMSYRLKAMPPHAMHVNTKVSREYNELLGKTAIPSDELYVIDLYRDINRFDASSECTRLQLGQKITMKTIWDEKRYFLRQGGGPRKSFMLMISDKEQSATNAKHLAFYGDFLDGFVVGNQNIIGTISDSNNVQLRDRQETISGKECLVIESDSKLGHFTLWVDEKAGYSIRKAVIKLSRGDLYSGEILPKPIPSRNISLAELEIEIKNIEILEIEGNYIPVAGTMIYTSIYDNEKKNRTQYTTKRTDIKLNPDFDKLGAFVMDGIPDGTRVHHLEMPGIRFVWQNGTAVLDVGAETIADIDKIIDVKTKTSNDGNISAQNNANTSTRNIEKPSSSITKRLINNTTGQKEEGEHSSPSLSSGWIIAALLILAAGCTITVYLLLRLRKKP